MTMLEVTDTTDARRNFLRAAHEIITIALSDAVTQMSRTT
jgi:hypothetical protein